MQRVEAGLAAAAVAVFGVADWLRFLGGVCGCVSARAVLCTCASCLDLGVDLLSQGTPG